MVTESEVAAAAEVLRDGGLVAFPTETVYGLGGNALNENAVASIFELKSRPRLDPLIVHIADAGRVVDLVESVPAGASVLMEAFWPGPLSLVLSKRPTVPDIVTAGLPGVALRCPDHETARRLIRAAGVPVAAPSANRFGKVSPTTAAHVIEQFGDRVRVLDDGPCRVGVESTVISFVDSPDGKATLLRPGGVTLEEIESVIGPIALHTHEESRPSSPGQLTQHYSPSTRLVLANAIIGDELNGRKAGLLSFQSPNSAQEFAAIEVLSEEGCLREAAVRLFAAIRRLDALGLDVIVAEPVPEVGLGRAIMDRLRRAAAR